MNRQTKNKSRTKLILLLIACIVALTCSILAVLAVPEGPSISYMNNYTKVASGATGGYNYTKGLIHEFRMSITQINNRWKAFVGNVSASLTLQDATYAIYSWSLLSNQTNGTIFASRNDSIYWSRVICSNSSLIATEETALSITGSRVDSIVNTFTATNHTTLTINGQSLTTCPTLHTNVNGTANGQYFQEVLLASNYSATNYHQIYATTLEFDIGGYRTGTPYDFQMIVPDYGDTALTGNVPYYFYLELA